MDTPERIWLQDVGDEITWCDHDATDDGVEYVKAERIAELEKENERLRRDDMDFETAYKEERKDRLRLQERITELEQAILDALQIITSAEIDNGNTNGSIT